ncbi:hypothetical protein D3C87_1842120 [compost metagenome]
MAWAASNSPAAFRVMPRDRRSNSKVPSSRSSLAIWRLTADGATSSFSAATLTEPQRATSRK